MDTEDGVRCFAEGPPAARPSRPWWKKKSTRLAWTAEPHNGAAAGAARERTEDSGRKQDLARARTVVETLDALKHSQDAKLLRVLQNEERLEEERAGMLAKVGTPEERYRLQKILGAERLAAGRRIAALTEAQKQELLGEQRRLEAESGFSLADCRVRKQRR